MRRLHVTLVLGAVLTVAVALAACSNPAAGTYTISGTFSSSDWYFINPIVVTVSQGSNQYSAQVNLSNPNLAGSQTITYSVSGVPSGTYTVTVKTLNNGGGPVFAVNFPTYTVNGVATVVPNGDISVSGSGPETIAITLSGMTVSGSETFDFDMGTARYL